MKPLYETLKVHRESAFLIPGDQTGLEKLVLEEALHAYS